MALCKRLVRLRHGGVICMVEIYTVWALAGWNAPHDDPIQTHDGRDCGHSRGQFPAVAGQRPVFGANLLDEVQTRVRLDINSARAAYHNHIERISSSFTAASLDQKQASALTSHQYTELTPWLDRLRNATAIDIVALLDSDGRVLYRANRPDQHGDSLADNRWSPSF